MYEYYNDFIIEFPSDLNNLIHSLFNVGRLNEFTRSNFCSRSLTLKSQMKISIPFQKYPNQWTSWTPVYGIKNYIQNLIYNNFTLFLFLYHFGLLLYGHTRICCLLIPGISPQDSSNFATNNITITIENLIFELWLEIHQFDVNANNIWHIEIPICT